MVDWKVESKQYTWKKLFAVFKTGTWLMLTGYKVHLCKVSKHPVKKGYAYISQKC